MIRALLASLFTATVLVAAQPARAHPHVWVTAQAEMLFAPDGKITGIRHLWTFDAAYSAFVTQGLDANGDGKLTPDELQELAKVNTESLSDYDYFTVLKSQGAKQEFDAPREAGMVFDKGEATLSFVLPLKRPAGPARTLSLEVYDPTYLVDFQIAPGDAAVRLANAPKGCVTTITRPKPPEMAQQQRLGEAFFEALSAASNFGAQFASRAIIACP